MMTEALRPFIPAQDMEASLSFYAALGFTTERYTPDLALLRHGQFTALLQHYKSREFAENYMLQWIVDDLDGLWQHIETLNLAETLNVPSPRPPAVQPWGQRVAFLFDPAGVLLHLAQSA